VVVHYNKRDGRGTVCHQLHTDIQSERVLKKL
jgi:hypothetical protein